MNRKRPNAPAPGPEETAPVVAVEEVAAIAQVVVAVVATTSDATSRVVLSTAPTTDPVRKNGIAIRTGAAAALKATIATTFNSQRI